MQHSSLLAAVSASHNTGLRPPLLDIDAKAGDYVIGPIRAPHTFVNPFDEGVKFLDSFTAAFYVNYSKLLGETAGEAEGQMRLESVGKAMGRVCCIAYLGC